MAKTLFELMGGAVKREKNTLKVRRGALSASGWSGVTPKKIRVLVTDKPTDRTTLAESVDSLTDRARSGEFGVPLSRPARQVPVAKRRRITFS